MLREDAENRRFGIVAATVLNAKGAESKRWKWKTWTDFFTPMSDRNKQSRRRGLTDEEILAAIARDDRDTYGMRH